MDVKREGAVFPPVPLPPEHAAEVMSPGLRGVRVAGEVPCEMCGAEVVVAAHCKRICLKCGFMTGCSEGL